MKRAFALLLCLCALLCALTLSVFAHPGGTDANGGHTDQSTGEYHYHHGYPAHYHTGGRCPYNFDDKTGQNSGSPSNNSGSSESNDPLPNNSVSNNSSSDGVKASDIIAYIGLGIIALFCLYILIGVIADKIKDRFSQDVPTESTPTSQQQNPPEQSSTISTPQVTHPQPVPRPSQPLPSVVPSPAPTPRPIVFASGILAEHPLILGADPDYLTEAQVLAYALSIETSRGKKAVTEQFIIKGDLTTDESTKPFQVSADIVSLGSAQQYRTTLVRCTCPDHRARHLPCKHMIALAINVNAITVDIEALKKREERS